jgi:RNA polymerase sigma factor (sigma-70 family)
MNGSRPAGVHVEMIRTTGAALKGEPVGLSAPSFEEFFASQNQRLLRALFVLTGSSSDAEEITQDTFVAVWERWDRVSLMEDPVGYLFKAALNRHRSRTRRALRVARRAMRPSHPADWLAQVEHRDALLAALDGLSLRRRTALVLVELLGYGSVDAGRLMGVADSTVRRLVSDAKADLRQRLGEEDDH